MYKRATTLWIVAVCAVCSIAAATVVTIRANTLVTEIAAALCVVLGIAFLVLVVPTFGPGRRYIEAVVTVVVATVIVPLLGAALFFVLSPAIRPGGKSVTPLTTPTTTPGVTTPQERQLHDDIERLSVAVNATNARIDSVAGWLIGGLITLVVSLGLLLLQMVLRARTPTAEPASRDDLIVMQVKEDLSAELRELGELIRVSVPTPERPKIDPDPPYRHGIRWWF